MEAEIKTIETYDDSPQPEFLDDKKIREQVDLIYEYLSEGVGQGKTAEVVYIPKYRSHVCYKIIAEKRLENLYEFTFNAPQHNSPKTEAYFLSRARMIPGNVTVPKPLCFWEGTSQKLGAFKVLVMEKLNAVTIQDLFMNQETLPTNFDLARFRDALRDYVSRLNESGISHNDITVTNVMIHRETGMPCIIDFGDSEKEFGQTEKPSTKDKVAVRELIRQLENYTKHSVSV